MRTTCTFVTREWGPISWTTCGSRGFATSTGRSCLVPPTHRLIHPVRRKKASKRTRQSTAGDVYVVGGYREEGWDPAKPGQSMLFVPLAALLFLLGTSLKVTGSKTIRHQSPCARHMPEAA